MANAASSAVSGVGRSRREGRHRLLALGLSAALATGTVPAGAQSDDENARRHFESGAAYLQQSDYDNALREFQSAYALSKRPPLLLNIANVYERMGKLQEAVDALTKYLEEDPKSPERTTHETRIANLKKRIEAMPRPAPAPAATAPSAPSPPPPAPAAAPAPPPAPAPAPPPPSSGPNRTPAFIAFGVGGAAAIGAAVTGLVAKGKYDDAEKQCKPNCTDGKVDSIKSMALVSDILTGTAVVGVGVGVVLLLTAGGSRESTAGGYKPSIAGGVGPLGGRLEATWRF